MGILTFNRDPSCVLGCLGHFLLDSGKFLRESLFSVLSRDGSIRNLHHLLPKLVGSFFLLGQRFSLPRQALGKLRDLPGGSRQTHFILTHPDKNVLNLLGRLPSLTGAVLETAGSLERFPFSFFQLPGRLFNRCCQLIQFTSSGQKVTVAAVSTAAHGAAR